MVMKKDRRKHDIKSKLVAAICMLLVSSIMMVSSTYAWFTLSTAPEVTGITTAVGANGNLEMALLPNGASVTEALAAIENYTGTGSDQEINNTWGNLVELDEGYGLDKITLFPSTLNGDGNNINADGMLSIPTYGADGRVSGMSTAALNKIYANGAFGADGYGVRAVGTSSGMSAREQAYRTALSNGNTNANRATAASKNSMSTGGSALASLAMKRATDSAKNATYTPAELSSLLSAFNLLTNENKDGAFDYIEASLKQYVLAHAISAASDDAFASIAEQIEKAELDTLNTLTSLPTGFADMISNLATAKGNVTDAQTGLAEKLNGATETTTFIWEDFNEYVAVLGNAETMYLNDHIISYWMTSEDTKNELLTSYGQIGLNLLLKDGVYVDLADYCGKLETKVTIDRVEYGGLGVNNVSASMTAETHTGVTEAYLTTAKATVSGATFTGGTSGVISDYYGYIIDMAFRTNVAGSYLQLQTDAVDRIYADQDPNEYTTGHGSSMSFTYTEDFDATAVTNLMGFIRVVFFDTATGQIFAHARLDNSEIDNDTTAKSVTMYLKLWDNLANDGKGDWATTNQLKQLVQNEATAISALVYLEGENIQNKDVANAVLSGSMNLQFSSSATLNPMEYGALRNPSDPDAVTKYDVSVNGITVDDAQVEEGKTYTLDLDDYLTGNQSVTAVTVTMGGQEVTGAWDSTENIVTIPNVSGDIAVTVTLAT